MKSYLLNLGLLMCLSVFVNAQSFDKVWETEQILKTPESVMFDAARNQIYVSNINGKPLDKDNNGFISILNVDGSVKQLKWITGINAPKGMSLNDSLLYVTDIDRIHVIDVDAGKIIKTVDVEGAVFLNDMAHDQLGMVYISDMKTNKIMVYNGTEVKLWLEDPQLISPNGLCFHKGYLFVGTSNQLLKVDPTDKNIRVYVDETGGIDGLVWVGGSKFVISDWSGRVMLVNQYDKIVLQNTAEANIQAADLGFIPDKNLILIPTFFDNRVVARKLP